MEYIIDLLILFIILSCVFKLSMMKWWQQLLYSLLLAAFAWWSVRYAVMQSKTQLADYLQNTATLQNMAILVTIESAVGLTYALSWLGEGKQVGSHRRVIRRLLWGYPSLLMFPVVFYLLTQVVFTATGVSFQTTALLFAAAIAILLPLMSFGTIKLLPDDASRVELYLLLVTFVCILGLISTQNGRIIYAVRESPINWGSLSLTLLFFVAFAALGYLFNRIKWKRNK
ncbi:MAG: hypothetical protein IJ764_03955 [Bacteroidales bacterium]|nr:hypothetical protein [Bacteroidales bacterium]